MITAEKENSLVALSVNLNIVLLTARLLGRHYDATTATSEPFLIHSLSQNNFYDDLAFADMGSKPGEY